MEETRAWSERSLLGKIVAYALAFGILAVSFIPYPARIRERERGPIPYH